mmetsp:Transcript_41360/g.109043  ORF Transcript_41360/g.109043 Transcript_41360/m.109043 type:complete len:261 (+) Transcript_41360:1679-2461(+)
MEPDEVKTFLGDVGVGRRPSSVSNEFKVSFEKECSWFGGMPTADPAEFKAWVGAGRTSTLRGLGEFSAFPFARKASSTDRVVGHVYFPTVVPTCGTNGKLSSSSRTEFGSQGLNSGCEPLSPSPQLDKALVAPVWSPGRTTVAVKEASSAKIPSDPLHVPAVTTKTASVGFTSGSLHATAVTEATSVDRSLSPSHAAAATKASSIELPSGSLHVDTAAEAAWVEFPSNPLHSGLMFFFLPNLNQSIMARNKSVSLNPRSE